MRLTKAIIQERIKQVNEYLDNGTKLELDNHAIGYRVKMNGQELIGVTNAKTAMIAINTIQMYEILKRQIKEIEA